MKDFFKKYKLGSAIPSDPTHREISALDFAVTIDKFICEHFRGLAKITYDSSLSGSLLVSTEYFAQFLKNLLTLFGGKEFIEISATTEESTLFLHLNLTVTKDMSLYDRPAIIKSARNAGFDVRTDTCGIVLFARLHRESFVGVYARRAAKEKLSRSLNYIFFG